MAFLFTDVEASTRLWETNQEETAKAIAAHDGILRHAIRTHDGRVFSTGGDAFCAAFASVKAALKAGVAAQLRLLGLEVRGDPLRVRMAIHVGEAEERDGDYFGPVLNRCARLMAAGHGGQLLLSGPAAALAAEHLPDQLALVDLGEHRLKDLSVPERIFEVRHPDLAAAFPPLRTIDLVLNNLPSQMTALFGRQQEVTEIGSLLAEYRLVTITGVGGGGKTRLALQAAAEVLDRFPEGVWFVDLAPVTDPGLVADTIADVLHLRPPPGEPLIESLTAYLRNRRMLLVIDNCEHLIDSSAAVISKLVTNTTWAKVLATSRERLDIIGERAFPIPTLPLPQETSDTSVISENPAIQMFVDRATAVNPDFTTESDTLMAIANICRRLDGLPLAIELVAARLQGLGLKDIEVRLENRFQLLRSGSRARPRQQTLEGAIAWSYDLLEDDERTLFTRLGVLTDTFDLEAAEATAGYAELGESDVADVLGRLVDNSMVTRVSFGEVSRYRLLESLRQFALARLVSREDASVPRNRLAQHFRNWSVTNASELHGPGQIELYRRIDRDLPNIRAAIDWSLKNDDSGTAADIAGSLWWHWQVRGRYRDGLDLLTEVVGARPPPGVSHAQLLSGLAQLATQLDLYDFAEQHFDAAEEMALRGGFEGIVEDLATNRAFLDISRGDIDKARSSLNDVLASARRAGRLRNAADARFVQGRLSASNADPEAATELTEALHLADQAGDIWLAAAAAAFLGWTLTLNGDFEQGIPLLERSRDDIRALGDPVSEGFFAFAEAMAGIRTGRFAEAQSNLANALDLAELAGSPATAAEVMVWVADWLEHKGAHAEATLLCGAIHSIVTSIGYVLPQLHQETATRVEAASRKALAATTFEAEYRLGQGFDIHSTLVFARQVLSGGAVRSGEAAVPSSPSKGAEKSRTNIGTS